MEQISTHIDIEDLKFLYVVMGTLKCTKAEALRTIIRWAKEYYSYGIPEHESWSKSLEGSSKED